MSRVGPTLLSLALAGVLTLAAYSDPIVVAAAVLLVQVLVSAAPTLLDAGGQRIPSPHVPAALAAGLVATVLTLEPDLLSGAEGTSDDVVGLSDTGVIAGVLPAVALAVFVSLIAQMFRKDGRTDLVRSTGYAVAIGVFAVMTSGWIGAVQSLGDTECVVVGAAGLAVGLLVWSVPGDRWVMSGLMTVAGGAAGAITLLDFDTNLTRIGAVVIGSAIGAGVAVAGVLGQVVGRSWSRGQLHPAARWGFPGALAIALAGPVVYIGGQLFTVPTI